MLTWDGFAPLSTAGLWVAFEPDLTGALGPVVIDDAGGVQSTALRHLAVITGINALVTPAGGARAALPVGITSSVLAASARRRLWLAAHGAQGVAVVPRPTLALTAAAALSRNIIRPDYFDRVSVRTASGQTAVVDVL